jgi:hypothetical protein
MPSNKDFKRLVRQRMDKTGESYTAARLQLIKKESLLPAGYEKLAGQSDTTLREKTGKTWREWVKILDAAHATSMRHGEIARHLSASYRDVSGWWVQAITVGYERIRGLRDVGQRRGGGYEANKSKTVALSLAKVWRAFSSKAARDRWLAVPDVEERSKNAKKTLRLSWPDGSSVVAYFVEKAPNKTQITIQHSKLATKRAADEAKSFWADSLQKLAEVVT